MRWRRGVIEGSFAEQDKVWNTRMMFSKGALHKSSARKVKESRKHQEAEQAASYETMLPLLGSGLVRVPSMFDSLGVQVPYPT
jgi:hypothetical protein